MPELFPSTSACSRLGLPPGDPGRGRWQMFWCLLWVQIGHGVQGSQAVRPVAVRNASCRAGGRGCFSRGAAALPWLPCGQPLSAGDRKGVNRLFYSVGETGVTQVPEGNVYLFQGA